MSSGKHFIYSGLTYFLAFCGTIVFYFDSRTGTLIRSRGLCLYGKLYCLVYLSIVSFKFIVYGQPNPTYPTRSQLMTLLVVVYPYIRLTALLSCTYCAQRWQHRIFNIVQGLLRVDKFLAESNYCVLPTEKPYLRKLFWIKLSLQLPRAFIFITHAFTGSEGLQIFLSGIGSKIFVDGIYFLTFLIIWKICYTFMKLQRYISLLYADPLPRKSRKEQNMLEAHRMYYKLIRMINEFCEIFKYPLASLLLLLICMTCVTGYSCCRALFGKPLMINAPITEWLTLFLNINYLLELYILTLTTNLTSKLHENILHDLRTTFCDSDLVERSVSSTILTLCYNFNYIFTS